MLLTAAAPTRSRYCDRAAATTDCGLLVSVEPAALIGRRSTSDLVSGETAVDAGDIDDDDDDDTAAAALKETGTNSVKTAADDDDDDDGDEVPLSPPTAVLT